MGGIIDSIIGIGKILDEHINDKRRDLNGFLHKPIGIGTKSYGFMEAMLHRNIGSHQYMYDGFGTNIGMFANPYLNSEVDPWFMLDESKKKYDNYLSYINDVYYHGSMPPPNFETVINSKGESVTQFNDYVGLYDEFSRVGVIHEYDIDNIVGAKLFLPNGSTNPNGYDDTRLGVINNFYLNSTLQNSNNTLLMRETSSYHLPSFGYDEKTVDESFSVTQGAYAKFGLKGEYGIKNGTFSLRERGVIPQTLLTNDIIPWSTVDSMYVSDDNFHRMFGILGLKDDNGKILVKDDIVYKTSPFGNFYSLSYSLGLLTSSGGKTKEFIAKSIFGVDLMSEYIPSLDYTNGDIDALKNYSRKKYFASIGSRGTNYVDKMTNIDVSYETNHLSTIRIILNDVGNDNVYAFNTFLTYSESEDNKDAVKFDTPIGNDGVNMGKFITYNENILSKQDIISYTNEQFTKNKYKTIIGRFHTDRFNNPNDARIKKDSTSTAVSQYGMSHGRNLLRKDHKNNSSKDFHNPYCRVWTYHNQYHKYSNLIRPFNTEDSSKLDKILEKTYQKRRERIDYSVRNKSNGLVNFAPCSSDNYKNCMFSIENLAWRDSEFSQNDKGPNGGRIMWFPPYGLSFNENVSAQWNASQFIGRGEKIYSYADTERSGTLSFQLLIDHPSILNIAHNYTDTIGDVDDVNSKEQEILRFFAGCDIITDTQKENEKEDNNTHLNAHQDTIVNKNTIVQQTIEFNIYFPFGYSGKDSPIEWYNYLINGVGCEYEEKNFYSDSKLTKLIGGYEMENNKGLSCVNNWEEYPPQSYNPPNVFLITKDVFYKDKYETVLPKFVLSQRGINNRGEDIFWGYLVDSSYKGFDFKKEKNYLDTKTYNLNCKKNISGGDCLNVSFADMAIFLGCPITDEKREILTTKGTQDLLSKLFEEYKVMGVNLISSSIIDTSLAKKRRTKVIEWLKKSNYFGDFDEDGEDICDEKTKVKLQKDINSKSSKEARKVKVVITLEKEILDLKVDYYDNLNNSIIQDARQDARKKINDNSLSNMAKMAISNIKEYERKLEDLQKQIKKEREKNNSSGMGNNSYNEYEFFNEINKENTFLRNKILEKIKYFDPAYHSITPEGFNSRLTFLHQCTRQGPTNSNDIKNLSFGAPPICVLRIGDFYNTKIIIDSLTMSYDDATWDLNDEGIGVMPMMAKIDINFKFIGGSDIGGAISYLQNAVSFNYYANTSIYEKESKKGEEEKK